MQDIKSLKRRILIIDDNPSIHDDYRKILAARKQSTATAETEAAFFGEDLEIENQVPPIDIQLDSAYQGQEAVEKVQLALEDKHPYSMAFVDMRMPPGWDGLRTVQELWKVQSDLQVVICTAYSDNTWDDICRQLGNTDQLLILKKPFDNIEVSQLAVALTQKWILTQESRVRQADLERMVEERTAELEKAALHDPLTGLANRTKFNERLDHALKFAKRNKAGAAILLIDLDCFKAVNDTLGHPAGDQLICGVANRLAEVVRDTDCIARLGGDEFAVLLSPAPNAESVSALIERLYAAIDEPFEIEERKVQAKMSLGAAVAPYGSSNPEQLLKHADLALYRAKSDGRGCYRFFEEEMDERIKRRHQIATELQLALEQDQFEIHYQPLFDATTAKMTCLEALIRWNHPERGLLFPGDFLDVAEDTGLIAGIGQWVTRQACADAQTWPEEINVAINVSAIEFSRSNLMSTIYDTLSETGLAPERVELEIVESVILRDSSEVIHALDQLASLGVKIVMDDFGTGYSSLSYLRTFPFDKIKLDRSFVQDAVDNEDALAIVRAVATLGKCLGLELTAEGVETKEQLDLVISEGYGSIQGYYYGRPQPLKTIDFAVGNSN